MGNDRPPLDYHSPDRGPPNGPGWFFLRMMVGGVMGIAAISCGAILASATRIGAMFWPPVLGAVFAAAWLSFKVKRRGYLTGVIVAPFLIVVALGALLFFICAGIGPFR